MSKGAVVVFDKLALREFCVAAIEKGDFAEPASLDHSLYKAMARAVKKLRSLCLKKREMTLKPVGASWLMVTQPTTYRQRQSRWLWKWMR